MSDMYEAHKLVNKWNAVIISNAIASPIRDSSMRLLCAHLLESQFRYNQSLEYRNEYQSYAVPIVRKMFDPIQLLVHDYELSHKRISEAILACKDMTKMAHIATVVEIDKSLPYTPVNGQDIKTLELELVYDGIVPKILASIKKGFIPTGPLLHIQDPPADLVTIYLGVRQ